MRVSQTKMRSRVHIVYLKFLLQNFGRHFVEDYSSLDVDICDSSDSSMSERARRIDRPRDKARTGRGPTFKPFRLHGPSTDSTA